MNTPKQSGFTIIEVMLFLAITGALMVGILIGSGLAIDRQRYRDSVDSLKGLFQDQYGQIANVINSEPRNSACSLDGTTLSFDDSEAAKQFRGTSDCLVLGKFMLIEAQQVTIYDVIGEPTASSAERSGDSETLRDYGIALRNPENRNVAWDSRLTSPDSGDDAEASVLIVRSPLSGAILTYSQDGDLRNSPHSMISDDNMAQKDFCVDPGNINSIRRRLAVRITAGASNQSAIEVPSDSENVCGS